MRQWLRSCGIGCAIVSLSTGLTGCGPKQVLGKQRFALRPAAPKEFVGFLRYLTDTWLKYVTSFDEMPVGQEALIRQALKPITVTVVESTLGEPRTKLPSVADYEAAIAALDKLAPGNPVTPQEMSLQGVASRLKFWCELLLENERALSAELDQSISRAKVLDGQNEFEEEAVVLCEAMQYRRQAEVISAELARVADRIEAMPHRKWLAPGEYLDKARVAPDVEARIALLSKALVAPEVYRDKQELDQAVQRIVLEQNSLAFDELDKMLAERWRERHLKAARGGPFRGLDVPGCGASDRRRDDQVSFLPQWLS